MRLVKKYAAILFLLSIFPMAWVAGRSFITEPESTIYNFIPQESDIVIEINNVNFISEFVYQRIFHEDYVMEKINFEEVDIETGIDFFSRIVLFREQFSNENLWVAIVAYSDKNLLERYIKDKKRDAHVAFNDQFAFIQLSQSQNQEQMEQHLRDVADKKIKPFTARVDLRKYFRPENEINCYFIPPSTDADNSLIDGHLSFNFHQNHVDIDGEFTPVSDFDSRPGIAYSIDENAAFSMRSSLDIFNSIYWFSKEKIAGIPRYEQMALDYDGVALHMVDIDMHTSSFPFKTYPDMQLRFDMSNHTAWQTFLDTLVQEGRFTLDSAGHKLVTQQGAFFKYGLSRDHFDLYQEKLDFEKIEDSDICFELQFKVGPLLDNTRFSPDKDNPPPPLIQMAGIAAAEEMINDIRDLANIEQIRFKLTKESESKIIADGLVQMQNRDGQSMIESMLFAKESIFFISELLSIVGDVESIE